MIRINDSAKFESIVNNIEVSSNNIEQLFQRVTENMKKIDDTDIWTGLAQKEFSIKYNDLASNYSAINSSLDTYISFMRQTLEDYKEFENQTYKDVDTNNVQLNVNS